MLSNVQEFDEGFADDWLIFSYDDCGKLDAEACPAGVQVQNKPLCWWTSGPAPVRLRRVGSERGAPVYAAGRETDEYAQAEVHTGDTAVSVTTDTQPALRRALAQLRPLDGDVGPLAPPARACDAS